MTDRLGRVREVIDAARTIAHDLAVFDALVASTGLSREGVLLALTDHLELHPSDDELHALVTTTVESPHVHVILSANVFVGALRAIAVARAASASVTVRPSSREPHFATALVRAIDDPDVRLSEELPRVGEVHVYGRDETIAAVAARVPSGVLVRAHGAGMGVAWVDSVADLRASAASIARDVVPFDQRGCLSPRVVLVTAERRAHAFADALHEALDDAETRVPRGRLDANESAELERWASTVAYAGRLWRGRAHAVGRADAVMLPPPGRHVHVVGVDDADLATHLAPIARWVVAFGASEPSRARSIAPTRARVSALGTMQRPPLDGPVDLRVPSR